MVTYVLREIRVSLAKSCGLRYVQIMRNSSRGISRRAAMVSVDPGSRGRKRMAMAVDEAEKCLDT